MWSYFQSNHQFSSSSIPNFAFGNRWNIQSLQRRVHFDKDLPDEKISIHRNDYLPMGTFQLELLRLLRSVKYISTESCAIIYCSPVLMKSTVSGNWKTYNQSLNRRWNKKKSSVCFHPEKDLQSRRITRRSFDSPTAQLFYDVVTRREHFKFLKYRKHCRSLSSQLCSGWPFYARKWNPGNADCSVNFIYRKNLLLMLRYT